MASPDLQDLTECSICLDPKVDPKQLACQHSYCRTCLEPLALDGNVTCPECRSDTPLPPGGVQNLPADFRTNQLMSALSQQRKGDQRDDDTRKEEAAVCENCHAPHVKYLCKTCHDYLCHTCGASHKQMVVFHDHELVLSQKCRKHPKKDRLYACVDCQEVICNSCVMGEHKHHAVKNVNEHIEAMQGLLRNLIRSMEADYDEKVSDKMSKTDLRQVDCDVRERFASIKAQINGAAARSIQIIKQEQCKMLAALEVDLVLFEKWVVTTEEAELLASSVEDLRSGCKPYVNATLPAGSDVLDGITTFTPRVRTMIGQIKDTHLSPFTSLSLPQSFSAASPHLDIGTLIYESESSDPVPGKPKRKARSGKNRAQHKQEQLWEEAFMKEEAFVQESLMGEAEMKLPQYQDEEQSEEQSNNCQIFVGNIPKDIDETDLMQFFRRYGKVLSVRIIPAKNQLDNYGFITFKEEGMARAVLNQREVVLRSGQYLKVKPNKHDTSNQRANVTDTKPQDGKKPENRNPQQGRGRGGRGRGRGGRA